MFFVLHNTIKDEKSSSVFYSAYSAGMAERTETMGVLYDIKWNTEAVYFKHRL